MWIMRRMPAAVAATLLVYLSVPAADKGEAGSVAVDQARRTVVVDARIAPRKVDDPRYREIYPIEVIACWPFPRGQKGHDTVVTIDARPNADHPAPHRRGRHP